MEKGSLLEVRQSAAEVLAAAVLQLCPDVYLIEGRATIRGFAYHFHFPSPFSEEMLPFIEEKMKCFIEEDLPISHREMIPENASQFFQSRLRHYPFIFAKQQKGTLVDVFEMKEFVDLCPGPYVKSTRELGAIKLIGVSKRPPIFYRGKEKGVFEINGVVLENQKGVKAPLPKKKKFLKMDHLSQGKRLGLFTIREDRGRDFHEIHQCFWLSEGERLRETLYRFWKKTHLEAGYDIVQTQGINLLKNHEALLNLSQNRVKSWKVAELSREASDKGIDPWMGLYDSKDYCFDRAHHFCVKEVLEKGLISSLQFLEKTSKVFNFSSSFEIFIAKKDRQLVAFLKQACDALGMKPIEKLGKFPKVLWKVVDRYGYKRSGPFIELHRRGNQFVISHSLFNQMERFIALLMEADGPSFEMRMKDIAKKRNFE